MHAALSSCQAACGLRTTLLYAQEPPSPGPPSAAQDIERAARAANAHDFISALPDGYNTMVGERGSLLSGMAHWKREAKRGRGSLQWACVSVKQALA